MSSGIMILMLSVSTFLGAIGLLALIWAVKSGQFDDKSKFIDGTKYDNQEDLKDAVMLEEKKRIAKEEKREKEQGYNPPD